jgi:hypothetical protein
MLTPPTPRTGFLRLTPVASRRTHLLAASLMWTLAGLGLCAAGAVWMAWSRSRWLALVAAFAIAVGILKGRFILERTAGRIIRRIEERGDGWCLGGFLSWKGWCLVAGMMVLGRLLRMSPLPLLPRGAIYLAIGVALLSASRRVWGAFRRERG